MTRRFLTPVAAMLLTPLAICGHGAKQATRTPCPTVSTASAPATTTTSPSPTCIVASEAGEPSDHRTGTGNYQFTLTQPIPQAGGTQIQTADLVISLTVDNGQVTGTIEGPTRQQLTQPACPSGTLVDGRTTAEVEGTLTEDVLELRVVSATWQRPQVEPCPGGGLPGLIGETTPSGIEGFEKSLSHLELADDGTYRYDHTETIESLAPFTVEYHVAVRFDE